MKVALVILDRTLQEQGLVPGKDYEYCANVHDEWVIDAPEEHAQKILEVAEAAIRKAGEELEFGCPLSGSGSVGQTWADVH